MRFLQIKVQLEKRAQGFLTVAWGSSSVCIYRATVRGRAVWPSACFSIIKFTGQAETPKSLSGRDLWARLRCSPSRSSQCIIENHPIAKTLRSGTAPSLHAAVERKRTCWAVMVWLCNLDCSSNQIRRREYHAGGR